MSIFTTLGTHRVLSVYKLVSSPPAPPSHTPQLKASLISLPWATLGFLIAARMRGSQGLPPPVFVS